jgi:hypothetical protein
VRLAAALLGVLLFGLACPASAGPAPVGIVIGPDGAGIRITYTLPRPVTRFALRAPDAPPPPRGSHVRVREPGLTYREGAVEAARPFRRFTLLVTPDDGEQERRYPLLTAVAGRGHVLYAPYLLPDGPIGLQVADGAGRLRRLPQVEAMGGYVPVGMTPALRGGARVVASTNMPPALEARLVERAGDLLDFYRMRLRRLLPRAPVLILSFRPPGAPADPVFRGDVTHNGVVILRFRGTPAQYAEPATTGPATAFLAHELFHLWGDPRVRVPPNEAFIPEGAAQYYGWLAVRALWPGEINLERNLLEALNQCAAFLGSRTLATVNPLDSLGQVYTCGPVVQWVIDSGIRAASGGRRTGFDLWAGLTGNQSYDAFRAAAARMAPVTFPLLQGLVETGPRWSDFAPALSAAGAEIQALPPTRQPLIFVATKAIVQSMCDDFWGAGFDARGVYFNSEPCHLPGNFTHLERIDGIDPMADPVAYYAHVRDACARQAELMLRLRGDGEASERRFRCTAIVDPPIPDFRIVRALPGPALSPPARSAP